MNSAAPQNHPDRVEKAVKYVTAAIGMLYVLGMLITNIQLTSLGLFDFSSVHARNVVVGVVLVFYCIIFYSLIATILGTLYFIAYYGKLPISFSGRIFLVLCLCIMSFLCVYLTSLMLWVRCLDISILGVFRGVIFNKVDLFFSLDIYKYGIEQMLFSYYSAKPIASAILIVISPISYYLVMLFLKTEISEAKTENDPFYNYYVLIVYLPSCLFVFLSFALLMVHYATEVYPNIRSSLGGGQPKIVSHPNVEGHFRTGPRFRSCSG